MCLLVWFITFRYLLLLPWEVICGVQDGGAFLQDGFLFVCLGIWPLVWDHFKPCSRLELPWAIKLWEPSLQKHMKDMEDDTLSESQMRLG